MLLPHEYLNQCSVHKINFDQQSAVPWIKTVILVQFHIKLAQYFIKWQ